jgi:glycine hydroxymethyltransferase
MQESLVELYLKRENKIDITSGFLAYIANLETVAGVAPFVAEKIVQELVDQRNNIKLIASENFTSLATQCAMGNLLTDKYAEGIPEKRYYAGCDNVDAIEADAVEKACELFGREGAAEHAYVQPHSGADANLIAFWAILRKHVEIPETLKFNVKDISELSDDQWKSVRGSLGNQRILGLSLSSGGHLTHGYQRNISAKMFEAHSYQVSPENHLLDYDEIEKQALEIKPLILLAGYSAYSRHIDFKRMREIADKAGAVLMVDMAHFAGLVAGKVFQNENNPMPYAQVVTTTTHKTLRGPRGGLILCTAEYAEHVDKGCPMVMGGPLPHVIAAKSVSFTEALKPEFKDYAQKIVKNSQALSKAFIENGIKVITGGTDNHLVLIDVTPFDLTGFQAESALRDCGITLNRNTIPFDQNSPLVTSGLRLGTPAVTTLGMGEPEMAEIASTIKTVLSNTNALPAKSGMSKYKYETDETVKNQSQEKIKDLLDRFPLYPNIDVEFLTEHFVSKSKSNVI